MNPAAATTPCTFTTFRAEQLKHDLDEVEELTTRVRDSISLDLSATRRYSPLLYEYYRKQMELAKSIQCTYNIQCNSLFDAMTLMRKCLVDYSQTVHNPEYLAINECKNNEIEDKTVKTDINTFNDYLLRNNQLGQLMQANRLNNSLLYSSTYVESPSTKVAGYTKNEFYPIVNESSSPADSSSSSTSACSLSSSNNQTLTLNPNIGSTNALEKSIIYSSSSTSSSSKINKTANVIPSISNSQTYV